LIDNKICLKYWWRKYQEKTTDREGNRSTRRKPPTVEETGVPGENHRPRRKPEYQEKTTDRGVNRSTRRKPPTVEETGVPGENN
jgi:transposase-like protein